MCVRAYGRSSRAAVGQSAHEFSSLPPRSRRCRFCAPREALPLLCTS
ncbi:hypothetical protein OAO87_01685 [bacterium]|nr:hypothetical protein [bacterium]